MSGDVLAGLILRALEAGDPMPARVGGLDVAWAFDLAPGEGDGLDELHYTVEVWERGGVAYAGFSLRDAALTRDLGVRRLTRAQVAALRDRWESLYDWPYNYELEGIAA